MKEYEVLNRLSHPNIIKPITCFETSQEFVLILPLMKCSLDEYLEERNEQLSEIEVIKIIKMIVEGVDHVHRQQMMHCDLKLENILVNYDSSNMDITKLVIIDFGISKDLSNEK